MMRADVEAAWGRGYKEHRTDDFRLYLHYVASGFVVFFERDGKTVYQFVYTAGSGKPAPREKKPTTMGTPKPKPTATPRKLQRVDAKKPK